MTIYQKIRFLTMVPILSVFMILGGQARSEEKVLNISQVKCSALFNQWPSGN